VTLTPSASSTVVASAPQGTSAAHSATFTSGDARSARAVTPPGLPPGTAISSALRAKVSGSPSTRPASVTVVMVAALALKKSSTGDPATICWARAELPP
jgi:hypothetical protein